MILGYMRDTIHLSRSQMRISLKKRNMQQL